MRKSLKLASFGIAFWLVMAMVGCTKTGVFGEKNPDIGNILAESATYEGQTVTLKGEYRGWEAGYGSPPVTRSDWVLKNSTGAIYVTGKSPSGFDPVNDIGKQVSVTGTVKIKDGKPYIEAAIVK